MKFQDPIRGKQNRDSLVGIRIFKKKKIYEGLDGGSIKSVVNKILGN